MRIEIRARNTAVTDAIREHVDEHFKKVAKQVPESVLVAVELLEERNPAIADGKIAEATLNLNGTTLRVKEASPDLMHSIDLCADKMTRQVKRHLDKRRHRRDQPGLGELAEPA
jgi:ribosomal subunit interface protein